MPAFDKEDRTLVARIAAETRWGLCDDRVAATAPARAGLRARFERDADPAGRLQPDELARRADSLMRAHMRRMSLRAAQARRLAAERRTASKRTGLEIAVLDAEADAA
jgi:hypothetical protein